MDWINQLTSITIIGRRDSGKTSLVYYILKRAKKPIFVFKHPKPELIKALGYSLLQELNQFEYLQDCIVWCDEPQLFIKTYEKKSNEILNKMLSIARHRNVTLILSTSDTRFINKALESYIDVWMVKDIEIDLVKRGSIIKKIIKDNVFISEEGFKLKKNEYLFYSRDVPEMNGKHTFIKPEFFTEEYSKPFRIANSSAKQSANETANNSANGGAK